MSAGHCPPPPGGAMPAHQLPPAGAGASQRAPEPPTHIAELHRWAVGDEASVLTLTQEATRCGACCAPFAP